MDLTINKLPEHLYSFLPKICLQNGVLPGGWDKNKPVVPAFDPQKKDPEIIKKGFRFGDERILVEIVGKGKNKFMARRTGPQNDFQGIYCSYDYISNSYLRQI